MSLEFRKIPNKKDTHLSSSTPLVQCRDQNSIPRALDFCTATLRHFGNYLVSDTARLLKTLEISVFLTYLMTP